MNQANYLIEANTKDLVLLLMEQQHMDMETALRTLYSSQTYHNLTRPETGLYYQSPRYIYDFLQEEMANK
jgi:hypothetical protein